MQVDTETGFVTKSILCMPIKNVAGKVIGVIQLVNKLDNTNFNKNDENLFEVEQNASAHCSFSSSVVRLI